MACRDMLAHAVCDNAENGGPWRKAEVFIAFGLRVLQRDVEAFEGRGAYLPTLRYPQALLEQRNLRQGALPDPGKVGVSASAAASSPGFVAPTSTLVVSMDGKPQAADIIATLINRVVTLVVQSPGGYITPTHVVERMYAICDNDVIWRGIGGPKMEDVRKGSLSKSEFGRNVRTLFEERSELSWTESRRTVLNGNKVYGAIIHDAVLCNLVPEAPTGAGGASGGALDGDGDGASGMMPDSSGD